MSHFDTLHKILGGLFLLAVACLFVASTGVFC